MSNKHQLVEILWNGKVHYRRPGVNHSDVKSALELIEKQRELYGFSLLEAWEKSALRTLRSGLRMKARGYTMSIASPAKITA